LRTHQPYHKHNQPTLSRFSLLLLFTLLLVTLNHSQIIVILATYSIGYFQTERGCD
jgi:hypothetical protein